MFARTGFEQCIVHIGDSDATERSWHILHTDRGPVAVALWYRRPEAGEVASIISLEPEIQRYVADAVGTIILGDLNVHKPCLVTLFRWDDDRRTRASRLLFRTRPSTARSGANTWRVLVGPGHF